MVAQGIIDQHSGNAKVPATRRSRLSLSQVYAYLDSSVHVFIVIAASIYYWTAVSEKAGLSALLTLSAIWQCLALSLLVVGALSTGSVKGISAKSLQLQAIALACRLSSTTWLQGYIPFDRTGNFLYASFDVLSLVMVLWLLCRLLKGRHEIKDHAGDDDLPLKPFVVGSLVLAGLFHANLDQRPIFDTLWMCSIFVGALAMNPQLRLTSRSHANVPAGMNRFVAAMAVSCIFRGVFFWYALDDFTSKSWFTSMIKFNLSGYAVLAAHVVQLMLLGDFAYFQVKKDATQGVLSEHEAWSSEV